MSPALSILIVNYNGGALLAECLDTIARQTCRDFEVIVVDNGSVDGSSQLPHFRAHDWTLIPLSTNLGFAEANNRAFSASKGRYVALVNNDVTLEPDWVAHVIAHFDHHPDTGSIATRLLQKRNPDRLDSAGFDYHACGTTTTWYGLPADHFASRHHRPVGAVASASAYRRSALDATGLFRTEFFAYYEDTDLALRLNLFGYDCDYLDQAVGYHVGSATGRRHSDFHRFQLRRNAEYVFWINLVGSLAARHFLSHFLYEMLAFAGMLARRQGGVFIRAKGAAFRERRWIRQRRSELSRALESAGGVRQAMIRLDAALKPMRSVLRERFSS